MKLLNIILFVMLFLTVFSIIENSGVFRLLCLAIILNLIFYTRADGGVSDASR